MTKARLLIAGLLMLGASPLWALGITDISNKIVTPNGDGFNDQVRITLDNPTAAPVEGRLYDAQGHEVAELNLVSTGLSTTLAWDGRTSGGSPAESGVYIFQITGDASHVAGMLAVAR